MSDLAVACIIGAYALVGAFTSIATYVIGNLANCAGPAVLAGFFWPLVPPILGISSLCGLAERMRIRRQSAIAERRARDAAVEQEMRMLP